MRCSHASSPKLIDWLVRCHGQAGEAGRESEAERWPGYGYSGMEDETCIYIHACVDGAFAQSICTPLHIHLCTQLASSGLVLVSCPWPRGRRSQLSACDGLIQTPPRSLRLHLRPWHSQTSTSIPQSLQPSASLLLLFSSWPMPGGHIWMETYWRGRQWKRGSWPPSWLWPLLEHALLSPKHSHSAAFISVSHVSYDTLGPLSLHLACWQQPAGGPSVPVALSNVDWMSYSPPAFSLSYGLEDALSIVDHGW